MRKTLALRILVVGAAWGVYALVFLTLAPRIGPGAASFAAIPALLGGLLLGWRGGAAMGLVSLLLNEPLLATIGRPISLATSDLYYASVTSVIGGGVGCVQEIRADLRRAAQASARSEERYQFITRATSDMVWDWDVETDKAWWSDSRTFGAIPIDSPPFAAPWTSRIHALDVERVLAKLRAVLDARSEAQWSDEYRFQRSDGAYALVSGRGHVQRDAAGRAIRMLGSLEDVTAKRQGELALRQSEESFRTLFENVPVGLYRTTPEGSILLANPALLAMLGYNSFSELAERDLNTEIEANYARGEFKAALEGKEVVRNLVSTWTTRDGVKIPVREDVRLVRTQEGAPLYYEGSIEDLSDRIRLEREAASQRRALERNEHLSALGTLVAGVAHEVNNPLAYIRGNVELVQMSLDELSAMELPPEVRGALQETDGKLEVALRGIDQLASIANSLKVVARRSAGMRSPENLDRLVKSVLLVAEARMPGSVVVKTELRATRSVDVVSDQLTQVLLNLLFNSADAVRECATGVVIVRTYENEVSTVIEVADNGVGIPHDEQAKIFVPFHTTKQDGTGLGLSLSHGIVQSLGGTLSFESEPGKGTTFRISLPAA